MTTNMLSMGRTGRATGLWVLVFFLCLAMANQVAVGQCADPPVPSPLIKVTVERIVDGDTVAVSGYEETVRLIGVGCPETRRGDRQDRQAEEMGLQRAEVDALGEAATAYTQGKLLNKEVGLELDVDTHDRWGRLLAYVWLEDGTLFNRQLVEDGYATVQTVPPNVKYQSVFLACQQKARTEGRGLWKDESTSVEPSTTALEPSPPRQRPPGRVRKHPRPRGQSPPAATPGAPILVLLVGILLATVAGVSVWVILKSAGGSGPEEDGYSL